MIKRIIIPLVILALGLAAITITGCVSTTQTGAEEAAIVDNAVEDSAARAERMYNKKKYRMFAYDKLKIKDWANARKYLWQLIDIDYELEYNEYHRLYQTYTSVEDYDSAQVVLQMGLEKFPKDAFLNATLGYYKMGMNEMESAKTHYLVAVESEPENVEYIKKLAEIYENLEEWENAIATYERLLELTPDDIGVQDSYTALLRTHRNPAEYLASLEETVVKNPEDIEKRIELLDAYVEQSKYAKVIEEADQIIALDASNAVAFEEKAKSQIKLGNIAGSIETYKSLLEVDAGNDAAMIKIADGYRELGNYPTARTWALKALSAAEDKAEANYTLGYIFETCADKCSSGRGLKYDDKLVFIIAYGLYKKAEAGDNYNITDKAERRIGYLKEYIPKYSDWFMHQSETMPGESCYAWINGGWSEVKYIDTYLKQVEQSK